MLVFTLYVLISLVFLLLFSVWLFFGKVGLFNKVGQKVLNLKSIFEDKEEDK
jgi:hypothetical protein